MFGEDGKKVEPSEFFKIFQDFVTMYFVSKLNHGSKAVRENNLYYPSILVHRCCKTGI